MPEKEYYYIATEDIEGYVGDGDSTAVNIAKEEILRLVYFDEYCMEFDCNGKKVTLDRERVSDKPCDYSNYFALPKGIGRFKHE